MDPTTPLVHRERVDLVQSMRLAGPDHSTLCEGWSVKDLAAHIVIRERRFDTAPGIVLPFLANYSGNIQQKYASMPFEYLLKILGDGPSRINPLAHDLVATRANTLELVVHHEDVRRAAENWTPREFTREDTVTLWKLFHRAAPLMWRHAHVPVTLMPFAANGADLTPIVASKRHNRFGQWQSAGSKTDHIILSGEPLELILASFGRSACQIRVDGSANAQKLFDHINRKV